MGWVLFAIVTAMLFVACFRWGQAMKESRKTGGRLAELYNSATTECGDWKRAHNMLEESLACERKANATLKVNARELAESLARANDRAADLEAAAATYQETIAKEVEALRKERDEWKLSCESNRDDLERCQMEMKYFRNRLADLKRLVLKEVPAKITPDML